MLRNTAIFRCPEADSLNSNDENACDDSCVQGPRMQNILENDSSNSMCPKSGDMQPIAREFRQHYERKLREICDDNNKECVQAKMKLQEDWIRDLTEQNEMLIKAVIELESEATERVKMLEAKLNESETCNCEAVAATAAKDRKIAQLQNNLAQSANNRFEESDQFRQMQENYNVLKQTMQDVRDALTTEVADKHDAIVTLRRDVQLLEEQCRRADQQTHFKDDIIKELRKDLKHLKQEIETCKSKKNMYNQAAFSTPLSHITYIPMTACSGRVAAELAPIKCENRNNKHSPSSRNNNYHLNEKPELLKNDKKDNFTVMHKRHSSPKHLPSRLHLTTSSSYLPSSCYTDKPKRTIFTSVKETASTARAIVDYLDLSISEGRILSEANRIMKRRQIKMLELEKERQSESGDCRK